MNKYTYIFILLLCYGNIFSQDNNFIFHHYMKATIKSHLRHDKIKNVQHAASIFINNSDDIILTEDDKRWFDSFIDSMPGKIKAMIWNDNQELERCCMIKSEYILFVLIAQKLELISFDRLKKICYNICI